MLHAQGTSREKKKTTTARIVAQANGPRGVHLVSPLTASLSRPDGTSCRYLDRGTGCGGAATIRSPAPGVVNFLTALFTRLRVPLASIDSTV